MSSLCLCLYANRNRPELKIYVLACHQIDNLCGGKINSPYPLHLSLLTHTGTLLTGGPWEVANKALFTKCSMATTVCLVTTHKYVFG